MSTYSKLANWGQLCRSVALQVDTVNRYGILLWSVLLYLAQNQQNTAVLKEAPSIGNQRSQQRWWSSSNKWTAGFSWVKRASMSTAEAHARPYLSAYISASSCHKHPSRVAVIYSVICNLIKRVKNAISNLTSKIYFQSSVLRICLMRHPDTHQ